MCLFNYASFSCSQALVNNNAYNDNTFKHIQTLFVQVYNLAILKMTMQRSVLR